jgi:VCBS repeat-containing protein
LYIAAPGVLTNDYDADGDTLSAVLNAGPSHGSLTLNQDGSFNYTSYANFNGADSFTYYANDGTADSALTTVTITINAVNDAPIVSISAPADGSSFTEGDSISFAGTAGDVEEGDLTSSLSWSSDLDGSIGTGGAFSISALSVGTHTITAAVNDAGSLEGLNQIVITITPAPTIVNAYATGEIFVAGTVSGDYTSTHVEGGDVESVTERESGGKPQNRYSYLEHKWTFNVTPGNTVTLYANVWSGGSNDGDSFIFAYSTNDADYIEMFTVNSTDVNLETYAFPPSIQGTVYVRVTDSSQSPGSRALDTIYVDHLLIRSVTQTGDPPAAPTGLSAAATASKQIDLVWTDTADNESGFYIERSPDGTNWSQIDAVSEGVTSYSDTTVSPDITYFYRVRAYNGSGVSSYSNIASATPPVGFSLTALGYKVKGEQTADLTWSGASSEQVDIFRDGNWIATVDNTGTYTDSTGQKGGGSSLYQVCEAGNPANCSNIVQADFD